MCISKEGPFEYAQVLFLPSSFDTNSNKGSAGPFQSLWSAYAPTTHSSNGLDGFGYSLWGLGLSGASTGFGACCTKPVLWELVGLGVTD